MRDSQYCFLNPHALHPQVLAWIEGKVCGRCRNSSRLSMLTCWNFFPPPSAHTMHLARRTIKRGGMKDERGFKECRASWKFLERRAEYWAAYGPYRNYQSIRVDEDSRAETSGVLKRMNRFEWGINGRWHCRGFVFLIGLLYFLFFSSLSIYLSDAKLKSESIFINGHNYWC